MSAAAEFASHSKPGIAERKLRIGIICQSETGFDNWALMFIDRIVADPRFELAGFLVHKEFSGPANAPLAFRTLSRVERALFARQPQYRPSNFDPHSQRYIRLAARGGAKTAELVRSLDIDIAVRLTSFGLDEDALAHLPFGEWFFNFSGLASGDSDWFAYREALTAAPSIPLSLHARRYGNPATACISACEFNTKPSSARAAASIKERAATLLLRELGRVADNGTLETAAIRKPLAAPPPGSIEVLRYAAALSGKLAARAVKAAKARAGTGSAVWTLYTGRGRIDDFEPGAAVEVPPSRDDIKADPFLFENDGECFLFYESYRNGDTKAHISVGRFRGDVLEPVGVALERPYHLSYPFVFRDGDDIFMMPESNLSGRIEIWRCVDFPLKWELHSTALEGQGPADSVLIKHDEKWWLFTNISEHFAFEDLCAELHIFQVDGPSLKHIVPHKRNPVVIGSTLARNAGRVVARNGRLLRPSQNNSHGLYGYGLNIMEIEKLNLDDYRERCIRTIAPDFKPGLIGCHHFDEAGGRYILDARLTV
jgi:hypothetical protein